MTTPSTPRKAGPYFGDGYQDAWPFAFKVFAASDVKVTIATAAGAETALVLGTDYTVALNANQETSPGGTVTYPVSGSALPADEKLYITGNVPYSQLLDVPGGGNFNPVALENQLDRTTMQIQQLAEESARSAKLPLSYDEADVVELTANITRLADSADNIDLVAGDLANIDLVAGDLADIGTVAAGIAGVNTVAGIAANVVTVAGISGNVTAVAGISGNVTTVAGVAASVAAVAGNTANINAVAGNESNIDAVAANETNIDAVAGNAANINAVAGLGAAVTAVAGAAADVTAVAAELAAVTLVADNLPAITALTTTVQRFSGNGSTTAFTLSAAPVSATSCDVYISGLHQDLTDDYTISGTTLTFTSAPPAGTNNISVKIRNV